MNRYWFRAAAALGTIALAGTMVAAQAPPAGAPGRGQGQGQGRAGGAPSFTNLQVFPKDIPAQQLVQTMQAFARAMGTTCEHCHVFFGQNNPMNDMASDMKPQKNIARAMIRMTQTINTQIQGAVPQKAPDQVTRVQCITCHRGQAIPEVAAAAAPGAGAPGGAPGAGRGAPGGAPGGGAPGGAPGPGRAN